MFKTTKEIEEIKNYVKMTDPSLYQKRLVNKIPLDNKYELYNIYSKTMLYNNKDGYYTLELLRKKMGEISNLERRKVAYYIDTLFRELNRFYELKNKLNQEEGVFYLKKRKKEFRHRFNYLMVLDLQTRNLMEELTNAVFSVMRRINNRLG